VQTLTQASLAASKTQPAIAHPLAPYNQLIGPNSSFRIQMMMQLSKKKTPSLVLTLTQASSTASKTQPAIVHP